MPRVVLGGIVGAMLSLAGASYQGVFRNPLVDPYLLGAAAGAGLGATLVFTTLRGVDAGWLVDPAPAAAFVVAIVTVFVTYVVGASFGGNRTGVTLVLAGVAVSSLADRRSRRSSCSATSRSSARSTTGSSVGCRRRGGPTSGWCCRT